MNLNDIIKIQKQFDSEHGWTPTRDRVAIINAINKDIIGIVGELGEFANLIKKINLLIDAGENDAAKKLYDSLYPNLTVEIVDTFIYLFRISSHLSFDVEKEYFLKLNQNKKKYEGFENEHI